MKKIISLIIATIVIFSVFCMVASAGDYYMMLAQVDNNRLFVNATSMDFDAENPNVAPSMDEEGTVLIPLRMVVGAAGGWIDWVAEEDKVVMLYNGVESSFVMGSNQINVGDEIIEVSTEIYTTHDRTMVPLDFFIKCMKAGAEFDKDTKTAMLAFETTVYAAN
ncbi:MAG: copper amine oxidase N-terminal domain-containing protein [Clostridia bacterium]|nr:copper amine oxidase N-terminal domain-containing protein [Clostridia bacterium]